MVLVEPHWHEHIARLQMKMTQKGDPVSFTDSSSVVLCRKHEVDKILAFDGHFEGFLEQVK